MIARTAQLFGKKGQGSVLRTYIGERGQLNG